MTYRLNFRIRRPHFVAIRDGLKLVEYRRSSPYWDARFEEARGILARFRTLSTVFDSSSTLEVVEAVFVCGKDVHRRHVLSVAYGRFEELAGRLPSAQGLADLGDGFVWGCFLGAET